MQSPAPLILVDAHVHIHDRFSLSRLVLISLQNFRTVLNRYRIRERFEAVLLLSESEGVDRFRQLSGLIGEDTEADFQVSRTDEPTSLRIETSGGQYLTVIAGRQIVTAERLEVLALGYHDGYPDGRPLAYVLQDLEESGCLRVLPWGAGKWLGRRKAIVAHLISTWSGGPIYVGDNGNRPKFWPLPALFNEARARGIYNLPGSDPLPFDGQEKKAGGNGFLLRGELAADTPFQSLRALLQAHPERIIPFGNQEKPIPFFKHQIAMQLAAKG